MFEIMQGIHVSLDLETLSRSPRATITEIGGVAFDPSTTSILDRFHRVVSVSSQPTRSIEPSTVRWWCEPERDRTYFFNALEAAWPLDVACRHFLEWLKVVEMEVLWANHPEFDVAILKDACMESLGMSDEELWPYRAPADMKSYFRGRGVTKNQLTDPDLYPGTRESLGLPEHNAVADAEWQALLILRAQTWTGA